MKIHRLIHQRWMSTGSTFKRAILFPGQGSQYVGMGKDLYQHFPVARRVFEEADEALQYDQRSLVFEGQQEVLRLTENAQPAILTTSIALLRVLEDQVDLNQTGWFGLGHSLGEYSALVAAGSLSLTDAVKLVRLRGQSMSKAVADQSTAMSALVVRKDKLNDLLEAMKTLSAELAPGEHASVANINSSFQVVLSGTSQGVDYVSRALQAKRLAAKAVDLPVSAPFHCALMQEAADVMKEALRKIDIKMPSMPVISNVTAKPYPNTQAVLGQLVEQVVAPVQWERSIRYCKEQGVDDFLCIGPGKVLANLLKKEYPLDKIRIMNTAQDTPFPAIDDIHKHA